MVVPRVTMFQPEEKELIHSRSLEILQKAGIQFNSEKALSILGDSGCKVDRNKMSAKIPPGLVEQCLETLPPKFVKAARVPQKSFVCGDGNVFYTSVSMPSWIRDLETRKRRLSNLEDLTRCAHLVEAMDEIQEWCPMVLPNDIDPRMRVMKSCHTTFIHTTKHIMGAIEQAEETQFFLEMIDSVIGHRDKLKENPILTLIIEPMSPLTNDGKLVDNLLAWSSYQPPIFMQVLPLAGATSPITLSGTVLQENASFLGNMVLYQLASPGWPIIWGTAGGILDMRSGQYAGGPEAMLMTLALVEMAKFYHVPCATFGASGSESKGIGYQTGMESMFGQVLSALAEVDNVVWPTDLDGFALMDLAHVLLGREAVRQAGRLRQGMELDDEHLMTDLIIKMKFKGEYLGDLSTKQFFRKEYILPDLFPRETFEQWEARDQSEEEMAVLKVKNILDNYKPEPLNKEIARELDRVYDAAEKVLGS